MGERGGHARTDTIGVASGTDRVVHLRRRPTYTYRPWPEFSRLRAKPVCLACDYPLPMPELSLDDDRPIGRCPECGRAFDPNDGRTFNERGPLTRWKLWLPAMIGGGLPLLVLLALLLVRGPAPPFDWLIGFVLLGSSVAFVMGYRWRAGKSLPTFCFGLVVLAGAVGVIQRNAIDAVVLAGAAALSLMFVLPWGFAGVVTRRVLAKSKFSQACWLPA